MKRFFVDTNYFLRFLVGDNENQGEIATNLFSDAAGGKVALVSSMVVLFEIYWVLSDYYEVEGEELVEKLRGAMSLSVEFESRQMLSKAIMEMGKHNFDLEDSYNMNYANSLGVDNFKTFDQKLLRKFNK